MGISCSLCPGTNSEEGESEGRHEPKNSSAQRPEGFAQNERRSMNRSSVISNRHEDFGSISCVVWVKVNVERKLI